MKKILFLIIILFSLSSNAQSKKQRLRNESSSLKRQIRELNKLIKKSKTQKHNAVVILNNINKKVELRTRLIRNSYREIELLNSEIKTGEKHQREEKEKLELLKKRYASFILSSYKNKLKQDKWLFLLSSDSFLQAYKRATYIKQYSQFRKQQAQEIVAIKEKLKQNLVKLNKQKSQKKSLLKQRESEKKTLKIELVQQGKILKTIKSKEKTLLAKMRSKQRKARALDNQIRKIIQREIRLAEAKRAREEARRLAKNKKYKGSKKHKNIKYSPTRETKLISSVFYKNKGKLPWPVKKGRLVSRFGKQPYPGLKGIYIENSGVDIATKKGSSVRSVFSGVVSSIYVVSNNSKAILIKHGDYYTLYNNISNVFVKKGDKVKVKQKIGVVGTVDNKTVLGFQIWKRVKRLNPTNWIFNMY